MKKFTAKQRAEIYRNCAIATYNKPQYGCDMLTEFMTYNELINPFMIATEYLCCYFPDWMLFSEIKNNREYWYWDNNDSRITAFLFAAEIAENPCYPYDEKFNK